MTGLQNDRDYSPHDAERFRQQGHWNDDTLTTWIDHWATAAPDKVAIVGPGARLTYREQHDKVQRLAGALADLGIAKGDVVAIQLPNIAEYLIAYYAVTRLGAILATMHMPYRENEMYPLIRHGGAKAVICGARDDKYDAPETMRKLMQRCSSVKHIFVLGDEVPSGMHSLGDMIDNGTPRDVTVPLGATDPALLCFTSGTSAAPKAVLRTYATITGNARIYSPTIELCSSDVVMVAPPFTHVFGLCCVHCTLCHGGTVVLLRQFTPPSYVEMIDRFKPSVVFTAPAHLAACLKAGLLEDVDLSSIREVVIAGSVCPPDIANALEARLPNGRAGGLFGMTETILITQTPITEGPEVRHFSVGRVTPGIEARIAGDDGAMLGADQEGELQVRGYSIMSGYLNNDEANRLAFTDDGWFRTGDLAVMSAAGDVQITGRLKDIINRGGIKINPTDLENLITTHPNVIQCAIVPMPDDVLGEKSCLFVTLIPGTELDLQTVTDYLNEHDVAKMKWPERLEVVEEMPMTPTKKIIKGALQERLGETVR